MSIVAEWITFTSVPEDWRFDRNPAAFVFIRPGQFLDFSGPFSDLTMTWPRPFPFRVHMNLAYVQSLLSACWTRDDAGDWQACVPEESPDALRDIIEAGGVELEQSCYTCAVRNMAGALPFLPLQFCFHPSWSC